MRDHVGSFFSGKYEKELTLITCNNKYEKEICFPENRENIRSCNKELHENYI